MWAGLIGERPTPTEEETEGESCDVEGVAFEERSSEGGAVMM